MAIFRVDLDTGVKALPKATPFGLFTRARLFKTQNQLVHIVCDPVNLL